MRLGCDLFWKSISELISFLKVLYLKTQNKIPSFMTVPNALSLHFRETLVKIHEIRFTLRISLLDTSFWLLLNIRRTLSRLCLWRGVKSPSAESPICLVFQRLLSPIGKMWSIQESLVASCQSILEFTYRIYIISECSDVWVELTKPNKILKDTQTFGSS